MSRLKLLHTLFHPLILFIFNVGKKSKEDFSELQKILPEGPYKSKLKITKGSSATSGKEDSHAVQEYQLKKAPESGGLLDSPNLNQDRCFNQTVTKGPNGFSLKRFLPNEKSENFLENKLIFQTLAEESSGKIHNNRYKC